MRIPKFMIEFTGHMMLHNRPPWFVYRPDIHKVRGPDVRLILNTVNSGDILLRRYDGYLNTIFTPGYWGHAGLYVGFNQMVHAVGKGTTTEDILNFCRCDAICVLDIPGIPKEQVEKAVERALDSSLENVPYDFDFSRTNDTAYCTERVDIAYGNVFYDDYQMMMGKLVLTPDGIRNSDKVRVKLEIKP